MKVLIFGMGHVGLSIAHACLDAGIEAAEICIVDRNEPLCATPTEQTSANAIGIIEPSGLRPEALMFDCYLRTREHYQQRIADGTEHISAVPVSYFSNEDGFLDGPHGRAPDENHEVLQGEDLRGFRFGERFQGILANTTILNWEMQQQLLDAGVRFVRDEITCRPDKYRLKGEEDASYVFDCRGLGLNKTEVGSTLFPVAGQTFLLHAPEGTSFDGILGNPGTQMSYNIVNWMKVSAENLRMLGLERKVDAAEGGSLVLVGASKQQLDYNWEPQTWMLESFLAGAAKLDPRVHEWRPVLCRKGMRAKEPTGIVLQTLLCPPNKVLLTLSGLAGNAYCVMHELSRIVVGQALRRAEPIEGLGAGNWC